LACRTKQAAETSKSQQEPVGAIDDVRERRAIARHERGDRRNMADETTEMKRATGKRRGPVPGSEQARRGGSAVREKYGVEFYARIGKQGGTAVKQKRGPDFYSEIGHKGGAATAAKHGTEFYSRIGKKGGERGRGVPKVGKRPEII
jgi:general stress protein YciG